MAIKNQVNDTLGIPNKTEILSNYQSDSTLSFYSIFPQLDWKLKNWDSL